MFSFIFFMAFAATAQNGNINAQVWDDRNADSNKQGSEPGIENTQVDLLTSSGTLVATANTNASGIASFTEVVPGNYKLRFDLPANHKFTPRTGDALTTDNRSDARTGSGNLGQTDVFSIASGQTINYVDAGMWAPGSLNTQVFDDRNADSNKQGSEPGIENVLVELLENDGATAVLFPAGHPSAGSAVTGTTNASGIASMDFVPADRPVKLRYNLPANHKFTNRTGDAITVDNRSDARTGSGSNFGETDAFSADRGSQTINYVDAGMWAPGKVNSLVWDDRNADRNKQGSEPGIANVLVEMFESDGSTAVTFPAGHPSAGDPVTAITASNGIAAFDYIPADRSVILKYNLPADHKFTPRTTDPITVDNRSDARTGAGSNFGKTDPFSVDRGSQTINYVDAGMWAPGTLNSLVWDDRNADRNKQGSEPGIAGVDVAMLNGSDSTPVLYPAGHPNAGNPVVATTAANGIAAFDYVPADRSVMLLYSLPANHKFTPRTSDPITVDNRSDARTGAGSNFGKTNPFSQAKGSEVINYVDTGLWAPGSLNSLVWDDRNADSNKQGSEPGIENVLVELLESDGATAVNYPAGHPSAGSPVTGLTNASGVASFDFVPADRAVLLRYNLPADHKFTPRTGDPLTTDNRSDARTGSGSNFGETVPFSVDRGSQTINYVDAGLWAPGVVQSQVWLDANGNGSKQGSEDGLFGVRVNMLENDGSTPVTYPAGHPDAGDAVTGLTQCGNGLVNLYIPADRSVILEFEADGGTFTTRAANIKDDNRSDARTGAGSNFGKTIPFAVEKGSHLIKYVDAGLTERGDDWTDATIRSFVWDDRNGNGNHAGEGGFGIENVKVRLTDLDGNTCVCEKTDADGKVTLPAISDFARFYKLKFDLPADHKFTAKIGGLTVNNNSDAKSDGTTAKFRINAGETIDYIEAGLWAPGSVNTFVFDDRNDNGNHSGEGGFGVEGVTVQLVELDGTTPVTYPGGGAIPVGVTGADGKTSIPYMPADRFVKLKYTLKEDHKYARKVGNIKVDNNNDAKTDGTTDKFRVEKGSETIAYVEAGMFVPGTIDTFVFDDRNDNGNHAGEGGFGIADVSVQLVELDGSTPVTYPGWHPNAGDPVPVGLTGIDGKTSFNYLPADRFVKLKYTLKEDHKFADKSGNIKVDNNNDAKTDGTTDKFRMEKGSEKIAYVEAGMLAPGSIDTFVFDDRNGNGNHAGEGGFGIEGVSVQLVELDGSTPINYPGWHPSAGLPVPTGITGTDGKTSFDYMPADRFAKLRYTLPADHKFTRKVGNIKVDNNNDAKTDGTTDKFRIEKGSEKIAYVEAGMWTPGVINTFVFLDANENGNHAGEGGNGVADVLVELLEQNGDPIAYPAGHPSAGTAISAVTGSDGKATLDYFPADRFVRVQYSKPGIVFTDRIGALTVDNNSDANPRDGRTNKFRADRGRMVINYVEAGLTDPGFSPPIVLPGTQPFTQKGHVRWRNFRQTTSGWDVGVGTDVGANPSLYNNTDFGNVWNFAPGTNAVTFSYDPIAGMLTATTTNLGGTYTTTYIVGNLGTVDYMQVSINGEPGQPLTVRNGSLQVGGNTFTLGDRSSEYVDYSILFDFSNGFVVSGEIEIPSSAASQESSKLEVRIGELVATASAKSGDLDSDTVVDTVNLDSLNLALYPNPVAYGYTQIDFNLKSAQTVSAVIYDMNGRVVAQLFDGQKQSGAHSLQWNVDGISDGVYMCKVNIGSQVFYKKVVVRR